MSTFMDELMAELINYGGIAAPRSAVYAHALSATGSERAADMFAFGFRATALTDGQAAGLISYAEALAHGLLE